MIPTYHNPTGISMTHNKRMKLEKSIAEFQRAKKSIPGGVNSPVRAFKSVDCDPLVIARAKGTTIEDIDGNKYTDFVSSWGPLILGHAHPDTLAAISEAAVKGTSFGAPTEYETDMAERIVKMFPSIDNIVVDLAEGVDPCVLSMEPYNECVDEEFAEYNCQVYGVCPNDEVSDTEAPEVEAVKTATGEDKLVID